MKEYWKTPVIDQDASLVAIVGDEPAALTMIRIDVPSGRAQNNVTGTRRAFRGRGLAHLLKTHGAGARLDGTAWLAAYDYYGHDLTGVAYVWG